MIKFKKLIISVLVLLIVVLPAAGCLEGVVTDATTADDTGLSSERQSRAGQPKRRADSETV